MRRILKPLLVVCPLAFVLCGCGGGGDGVTSSAPSQKGSVTFHVDWPTADGGRMVPKACNVVEVKLYKNGEFETSSYIVRPATETTIGVLEPGDYTATVTAYPEATATGVAQARGSATGPIRVRIDKVYDQNNPATYDSRVDITMAHTVAKVEVTATPSSTVSVGGLVTLTATAKDADNHWVIVADDTWRWESPLSNQYATATPNGNTATVTGIKADGALTVSATYAEPKTPEDGPEGTGSATVTVSNPFVGTYDGTIVKNIAGDENRPGYVPYTITGGSGSFTLVVHGDLTVTGDGTLSHVIVYHATDDISKPPPPLPEVFTFKITGTVAQDGQAQLTVTPLTYNEFPCPPPGPFTGSVPFVVAGESVTVSAFEGVGPWERATGPNGWKAVKRMP